jgi:carboxyl-terminal processing protease
MLGTPFSDFLGCIRNSEDRTMSRSPLLALGVGAALLIAIAGMAIGSGAAAGLSPAGLSSSDLALISSVVGLIKQDYVHPIAEDRLADDTLKGLLTRLDPHSAYLDEREYREVRDEMSGKFGGIGVEIEDQAGIPMVISPIDGTPAAEAGIQPGDRIIAVDGKGTAGMDATQVVNAVRGKPGSAVTLTISRNTEKPFDVTLNRSVIQVHTVVSKLQPNGIGYLRISQFEEATPRDLKQAIATLRQNAGGKLKGLVLDLRNDPGGLLNSAVEVSRDFLDGGTIVSVHGRNRSDDHVYQARAHGDLVPGTPIAVLINGASASASEIVTGALQDLHRATVLGTRSFGKGSVQSIIALNGHGALRLTTGLYYTPSGRSIQGEGIDPDVTVEAPKEEQVTGAMPLRESMLHGAFTNPGPLAKTNRGASENPIPQREEYSAPIRTKVIGTPEDAQLQAALGYLARTTAQRS